MNGSNASPGGKRIARELPFAGAATFWSVAKSEEVNRSHSLLRPSVQMKPSQFEQSERQSIQWIGLRENLQESPIFHGKKSLWFPVKIFPNKPIHGIPWHSMAP